MRKDQLTRYDRPDGAAVWFAQTMFSTFLVVWLDGTAMLRTAYDYIEHFQYDNVDAALADAQKALDAALAHERQISRKCRHCRGVTIRDDRVCDTCRPRSPQPAFCGEEFDEV